jgi:hypothetical protein
MLTNLLFHIAVPKCILFGVVNVFSNKSNSLNVLLEVCDVVIGQNHPAKFLSRVQVHREKPCYLLKVFVVLQHSAKVTSTTVQSYTQALQLNTKLFNSGRRVSRILQPRAFLSLHT